MFNIVQHLNDITYYKVGTLNKQAGIMSHIYDEFTYKNNDTNRIFLVDDEQDIILTFRKGLKQYGFDVDAFNDPQEALSNFKSNWYGLLLLDIRMPKMNGFELYKKLRNLDNNVKVCFTTAYESYYDALKEYYPTLDVGCFIRKPISTPDLVRHISTELSKPLSSSIV